MDRTHLLQKSPDHNGVEADDDQKWEKVAKDKEANLGVNKFFLKKNAKIEILPISLFPVKIAIYFPFDESECVNCYKNQFGANQGKVKFSVYY